MYVHRFNEKGEHGLICGRVEKKSGPGSGSEIPVEPGPPLVKPQAPNLLLLLMTLLLMVVPDFRP